MKTKYTSGAKESCKPDKTNIAWTNVTFNPVWGCQKVSEACKNFYAETISRSWGFGTKRPNLWKNSKETTTGKGWQVKNGRRVFGKHRWKKLLDWDKKAKLTGEKVLVFAGSMCDVFEDHQTTSEELKKLWEYIRQTPLLLGQAGKEIYALAVLGFMVPGGHYTCPSSTGHVLARENTNGAN